MKSAKRKRLETRGWKVGTVAEFLQLSPEESAYIEMKLALSKNLQECRNRRAPRLRQSCWYSEGLGRFNRKITRSRVSLRLTRAG